jgi:hypothetical protein
VVVPLDIVPNQLKACALVEWLSWRCQLGLLVDRVRWADCGRCFESGIPFEVAQRAQLFRLFEAGGLQRELHHVLAERGDEVKWDPAAIIIMAVAAQQTLVGHWFNSMRVYH